MLVSWLTVHKCTASIVHASNKYCPFSLNMNYSLVVYTTSHDCYISTCWLFHCAQLAVTMLLPTLVADTGQTPKHISRVDPAFNLEQPLVIASPESLLKVFLKRKSLNKSDRNEQLHEPRSSHTSLMYDPDLGVKSRSGWYAFCRLSIASKRAVLLK